MIQGWSCEGSAGWRKPRVHDQQERNSRPLQDHLGAEDGFRGLGGFGLLPKASNEPFYRPILASDVVDTVKRMKEASSPGPDGLKRPHIRLCDPKGLKLSGAFNDWLVSGILPKNLKASTTTLIPKSNDPSELSLISNWRPITLSRGLYRGTGASENITVLSGLIRISRGEGRNLAVVFIDLAKAFDTVSHQLIRASLEGRAVDGGIVRLVEDSYRGCHSRVKTKEGPTEKLAIKLGVKQGDPLSPTLFNLSLDPLLYALDKMGRGVEFGEDSTVTSLAYADDLVLLSDSWDGMARNLAIVEAFSGLSGLKTNPKKCASFFLQHVGRKVHLNNCSRWVLGGQPIKQVGHGEHVKYLGVLIEPTKGVCSPNVMETLDEILCKIGKAPLKPSQKIELLRVYALPRLLYVLDYSEVGTTVLTEADRHIRKSVKEWLHLDHFTCDGLLYARFKDGGLSIPKLSTQVPAMRLRRLIKMVTSEDHVTNEVSELLKLGKQASKVYESLTGMEAPESLDLLDLGRVSARALKEREFSKWKDLAVQGKGVAHFKDDKTSNFWCQDPVSAGLTESEFLIALKLRSNTFRTGSEGWSSSHDDTCRLCGIQRPTLAHVVSHCPKLREQRMQNHNKICQAVREIAESKGWSVTSEGRFRNMERLWVPDLLMVKDNTGIVLDVTITFENEGTDMARIGADKAEKYEHLDETLRDSFGCRRFTLRASQWVQGGSGIPVMTSPWSS
ncbi:hypothetical protein WMY93_034179 [Mugilogobius chulae]|uniref:ribonuclease H n=1 Tax=Mugilogobius chulae TaxID=88201 RepID=A0AAW0MKF4_9GOBI